MSQLSSVRPVQMLQCPEVDSIHSNPQAFGGPDIDYASVLGDGELFFDDELRKLNVNTDARKTMQVPGQHQLAQLKRHKSLGGIESLCEDYGPCGLLSIELQRQHFHVLKSCSVYR